MIVLVDSNVPMYLVGAAHPHKIDAQCMLERHIAAGDRLVTDADFGTRHAPVVAVMRAHAIESIMTFDRGFDRFPGVKRIGV